MILVCGASGELGGRIVRVPRGEGSAPLSAAKVGTEDRLIASPLREVIVRPDQFQQIWCVGAQVLAPPADHKL